MISRLLGARSKSEMAGLVLDEPAWEIDGVSDPAAAFAALPMLAPEGAYLFLEGGYPPERLRTFLEECDVKIEPRPALGTIWPAAPYVSIAITQPTVDRLVELAAGLPLSEVCWHMHVFVDGRVLLSGHDAFTIPFLVSADVPEERVQRFSRAAGGTASHCGGPSK